VFNLACHQEEWSTEPAHEMSGSQSFVMKATLYAAMQRLQHFMPKHATVQRVHCFGQRPVICCQDRVQLLVFDMVGMVSCPQARP
jgi:hypothetical protein